MVVQASLKFQMMHIYLSYLSKFFEPEENIAISGRIDSLDHIVVHKLDSNNYYRSDTDIEDIHIFLKALLMRLPLAIGFIPGMNQNYYCSMSKIMEGWKIKYNLTVICRDEFMCKCRSLSDKKIIHHSSENEGGGGVYYMHCYQL